MKKNLFAGINFDTLSLEGTLFTAGIVQKILQSGASSQTARDYAIPLGLGISDEVGRSFQIAQALWAVHKSGKMTLAKFTEDFFRDCLGYSRESFLAVVNTNREDAHWELRAVLNKNSEYTVRLFRPSTSLGRPSFVEFNLETILSEKRFPDFKMLWLFFHASRSRVAPGSDSGVWDAWKKEGEETGVRVRDKLRDGVTAALVELGRGFLTFPDPDNEALRKNLVDGTISAAEYYAELLRLIYRFLFLITIEERGLLFEHETKDVTDETARRVLERAHEIYNSGYSLRRLRDRALVFHAHDTYSDIWASVKIVWASLAHGEPLLDLPSLGGLFGSGQCPNLDRCSIANAAILEAMRTLRWTYDEHSRLMLIDYKNLGVEELGLVYESLLELEPRLNVPRGEFDLEGKGNNRKTTGSYYTDESLVLSLIKSNLDPLIEEKINSPRITRINADKENKNNKIRENPCSSVDLEKNLLSITVIDPACGSGHFLLAAARRLAEHLAHIRHGEITDANYRTALRDIIASGIYGVDLNPLAVELARMALWLEGYEPGKPLSFLDHHIRRGNSLVGVLDFDVLQKGIPDDAYKALSGDEKEAANAVKKQNRKEIVELSTGQGHFFAAPIEKTEASLTAFHWRLENAANNSLDDVEQKRRLFDELLASPEYRHMKNACDLYTAAFYAEKKKGAPVPTTADVNRAAAGQAEGHLSKGVNALAARVANENAFFHWRLEFPEVFSRGGFDCVLGNPPWERIKLQEEEYFAQRSPDIAGAPNKAARERMIHALKTGGEYDKKLYADFLRARRDAEAASSFAHVAGDAGGRFPLTGTGDVNTYALFAEIFLQIRHSKGRAGFIVPTGIATDDSTKKFFMKISSTNLVSLYSFENESFIFPAVHHSFKFCLISLGESESADLAFFIRHIKQLEDKRRHFTLSRDEFMLINPNTQTCPIFRSEKDAELTKKIYRKVPVLIRETTNLTDDTNKNPWGIQFQAMFHMANDSGLFYNEPGEKRLPLYEAKMIHQFDHRWATYTDGGETVDVTTEQKQDDAFTVTPRYWVDKSEVEKRLSLTEHTEDTKNNKTTKAQKANKEEDSLTSSPSSTLRLKYFPKWLMGWRDVTNAIAIRTVVASIIPLTAVGHKMPLFVFNNSSNIIKIQCFYANLNSLVFDYIARQKVGGISLTYHYLKQFPILPPSAYTPGDLAFIVPRVLELTYTAVDLAPFAEDIWQAAPEEMRRLFVKQWEENKGPRISQMNADKIKKIIRETPCNPWTLLEPFTFDPARRARLRAELDARYARLYGLSRDELAYILDPADVCGADYPSETFRVLKEKETAEYGEYRTRRLVLEAWDGEGA
jgi:hypothetical protein